MQHKGPRLEARPAPRSAGEVRAEPGQETDRGGSGPALPLPIVEGPLPTARLTVHHLAIRRPGAPKVLLLGGSNFDLRLKRTFLDTSVAREADLVTYEPRGIGRTEQPDGLWTMDDYARDALAVLDALEWDDALVIGESFGGMTALHLALLAPKRVYRLVLASATGGGPDHASFDISQFLKLPADEAARSALCLQDTRRIAMQESDPEGFGRALQDRLAFEKAFRAPSVASGGYARLLAARRLHDCSDRLSMIERPTSVIAGRFDRQARPDAQRALAAALPNADFTLLDAGHGVLFTDPEAVRITTAAIHRHRAPKETSQ